MVSANHKRAAAEPAPDIRTSSRPKIASSKQREISEFLSSHFLASLSHGKVEQAETDASKELERVKRQLLQQKRKNQRLTEIVQGN